MISFNVLTRFTGAVQFTAQIECNEDASATIKLGLAVKWAIKNGAYLRRYALRSADLSGADLSGADLCGADLSGAYLSGADLSGANLSGANLSGANLRSADLRSADLSGAYLSGADLSGANLCGANLRSADLCGADLCGADLCGADLCGADLCGAYLYGAYLYGADLGSDQWIIQGSTRSDGYAFFLQKLKDDKEPMIKAGCRYFTIATAQEHWESTRKGQKLLLETRAIICALVDLAHIRGYMKDGRAA